MDTIPGSRATIPKAASSPLVGYRHPGVTCQGRRHGEKRGCVYLGSPEPGHTTHLAEIGPYEGDPVEFGVTPLRFRQPTPVELGVSEPQPSAVELRQVGLLDQPTATIGLEHARTLAATVGHLDIYEAGPIDGEGRQSAADELNAKKRHFVPNGPGQIASLEHDIREFRLDKAGRRETDVPELHLVEGTGAGGLAGEVGAVESELQV